MSWFCPAQAQKLASNHTVDVSLCEVRVHSSSCKRTVFYQVGNVPHALCPSEPSTGRLQRLQRHRQKCGRRLRPLLQCGLRSGRTAQTPVVGGGLGQPDEKTLRKLCDFGALDYTRRQGELRLAFCSCLEPTGRQQTVCLPHFMDGDEKEVGCDNKTHSVGVCARGRSTDGNKFRLSW